MERDLVDKGYKLGVSDVVAWHMGEVAKLAIAIKKAYVEIAEGRTIQIGVVWEGKHCSADQLIGLAQFHTDCAKAIEEHFKI